MKKRTLGRTEDKVSEISLGTMTWGSQNTQDEAFDQMNYALEHGVDFWDTAEMYPVTPISPDTCTTTEEYIGNWFKETGRRDEVYLATKASGVGLAHVRDGKGFADGCIMAAIEGSLKRLKTDYIDLYQLHWPQRGNYHFRNNWTFNASTQSTQKSIDLIGENLRQLHELQKQGKIKHVGLSNESAWGANQFLKIAEAEGLPRVVSTQNEYSLLYRSHDMDWAEVSHHEDVGLLAYSPLATGLLTGKYANGQTPAGSRKTIWSDLHGRDLKTAHDAVASYQSVADKHGLNLTQMSIAWCLTRPFMTSVIIGATSMEQLKTCIGAAAIELSDEVLADIDAAHRQHAMPF